MEKKIVNEKMVLEALKSIQKTRRFKNIEELKVAIATSLRINLWDMTNIKIDIVDLEKKEDLPKEIDFLISGTVYDTKEDICIDFDIYYAKTRSEGYYVTEFIMQ